MGETSSRRDSADERRRPSKRQPSARKVSTALAYTSGEAPSVYQAAVSRGYAPSTARNATENGIGPAELMQVAAKVNPDVPSTKELEARSRAVISQKLEGGSEGMAVAVWKTSNEILSGEPAVSPGVSAEDQDEAQGIVDEGVSVTAAWLWELMEQPGPPPELPPEVRAALQVKALFESRRAKASDADAAVPVDVVDAEVLEPETAEDP